MASTILGISAYYHDSAAALLRDGDLVAAAQEERFTRKKHDPGFPRHAIEYCLQEVGIGLDGVDQIVFYDKPLVKFERLLETYLSYAPHGIRSFIAAMPIWLKEKLYLKSTLKREFCAIGACKAAQLPQLMFATAGLQVPGPVTWQAAVAIVFLGLLGTGIASILYFKLIAQTGARFTSLLNYLVPVWAVGLGVVFLGETLPLSSWLGLILILSGLILTSKSVMIPLKINK